MQLVRVRIISNFSWKLCRKGINSLVLEKFDTLRASGAAITVYINGWHALDQLGIGMELRRKAIPLTEYVSISFGAHKNPQILLLI